MAINNPFSRKKIKYLKTNGKSNTVVRTGSATGGGKVGAGITDLNVYWQYYQEEGTIFASINSMASNTVMVGYSLSSENDKARELITSLCKQVRILNVCKQLIRDCLIFGDAFAEKIKSKDKGIARIKNVDSRTIVINDDEFGDVVDFQQKIGGKLITPALKPEDMIHLKLFPIPGSPNGLSLMQPSMDTITRKVSTDESIFNAIQRHTAKYIITVGSEKDGQVPPSAVMDDIKEEFEDINSKNEFVVPWFIKIGTIDERGVQGVQEYFDLFQTQMVVGFMCPEEALGLGKGSTEATSRVKAILYERTITGFQNDLSVCLENQLFKPYLENNGVDVEDIKNWVTIKFNSVTEEDEALRAKWMGNIIRGFKGEIPLTGNEFRIMFGYEPIDGLDELMTNDVSGENVEGQEEEEGGEKEDEESETSGDGDTAEVPEEDNTKE